MESIVMTQPKPRFEKNVSLPENREISEVKETIACVAEKYQPGKKRKFTVSEMWNRHRQRRSASAMIRKWNLN